tara:strand:- start:273 stop:611 length:339 start_codon:yes stop_codon:yes gene_type:complete
MSDINPHAVYQAYIESGNDYADKRGAAELLEGSLKSLKAQITLEAKAAEKMSVAEAELIAGSSNKYRDAMKQAIQARTEANRAQVRYTATQALWEAQRSQESSQRAAMRSAP